MSHDRRRPVRPYPIVDPTARFELKLIAESRPEIRLDSRHLAAEVMQALQQRGFDCEMADYDEGPLTVH